MRYLPAEISYGIECAVECGDITADVCRYYHSFNEFDIVAEIDALDNERFDWDACHRRYADLYNIHYTDWFKTAPQQQRLWCLIEASPHFRKQIAETSDHLYGAYVSAELAHERDPSNTDHMREFLHDDVRWQHVEQNVRQLVDRINLVGQSELIDAYERPDDLYIAAQTWNQNRINSVAEIRGNIVTSNALVTRTEAAHAALFRRAEKAKRIEKKKVRKVLKKSSSLLSRILGQRDTTAFIRGDEIEVVGHEYNFRLKKNNIMTSSFHGFNISVMHRASGERMVDLCWYVEATPALDQLAALVMAVRVGDEEDIIRVGNLLRISQEAYSNEDFAQFLPEKSTQSTFGDDAVIFRDEDRMLRRTPGTQAFIQTTPQAYRGFMLLAKQSIETIIADLDERLRTRYRLFNPEEFRVLTDSHVGRFAPNIDTPLKRLENRITATEITSREIVHNMPPEVIMPLVQELNALINA